MRDCLIFGDSITQGFFAIDNWVTLIWSNFLELNPKKRPEIFIHNLGVAGNTSSDLVKRMSSDISSRNFYKDPIIIIAIGINDSKILRKNKKSEVSLKDFKKNINKLYSIASKKTNKIIFVGLSYVDESKTNPCFWEPEKTYKNDIIIKFDKVIKIFCKEKNIAFADIYKKTKKNSYLFDGLHPNSKGHKIIYKEVIKKIKLFL